MKIIAFTKDNSKYERFNFPEEDSFKHKAINNKTIVAVADGIARDAIGIKLWPNKNNVNELEKFSKKYPRPSPAKVAADLFCKCFLRKQTFKYVNDWIRKLNKKLKVDYLENDFAACVAVGGVITSNQLYYQFIGDCGVCVFNKNGKLKFKTKDESPNSKGSIEKEVAKKYKTSFKFPKGRKIIRSKYRNNPANPLSYGALTGEKNAMKFVRIGEFPLEKEDYIIFYTDGMLRILFSKHFDISKHFHNLEDYVQKNSDKITGSEGTAVAIQL